MKSQGIVRLLSLALVAALAAACSDTRAPEGAPHPIGIDWVGITAGREAPHGEAFDESAAPQCSTCHNIEQYCSSRCHFGPSQEPNVQVPPGVQWVHGSVPHRFPEFEQICNTCHRILRGYGQGPGPCHDCHGGGTAAHKFPFADPADHGPPAKRDLISCAACHAIISTTSGTPRFDVPIGDLAHGCESDACHNDFTAHPSVSALAGARDDTHWYGAPFSHADAQNVSKACTPCHGADLTGGTHGPACTACHTDTPVGATASGCVSCHGSPPDGSNATSPPPRNRQGAHGAHDALPEAKEACDTCHQGAGNRTTKHFNQTADVAIATGTYDAKAGGPARPSGADDRTCLGVSCHGGQETPKWRTGTLDVSTVCTGCHAIGTTQYNSFSSGAHEFHVVTPLHKACTDCHSAVKLAPGTSHFAHLKTPVMEGPASATIAGAFISTYVGGSCTPNTNACHSTNPTRSWGGGVAPHPTDGTYRNPALHGSAAKDNLTACQPCHAEASNRFDVPRGSLITTNARGNGCEYCHNDQTAHPSVDSREAVHWYGAAFTHAGATQANLAAACGLCHGAGLTGGAAPGPVGPSCRSCHTLAATLPPVAGCVSCHGNPPTGASAPDRQGAHAVHNGLPKVTGACATCHTGAGYRTVNHFIGTTAVVAISTTYYAKSGAATRNANGTCSNTRCHGGVATPVWLIGTLDVNASASCVACHIRGSASQTPQYNSPYSGEHNRGNHVSNGCTSCHDVLKLQPANQKHFSGLDTPAFETVPSSTLRDAIRYNGSSCNPSAGGLSGCHGSESWTGGGG